MRSVTSCFNSTLYGKTMMRFWPLWVLHGLIWLFAVPLNLINQYFNYLHPDRGVSDAQTYLLNQFRHLPNNLEYGVSLALAAGVLCAMAVFGYLYNNRSACMMHALPMRRESLFLTQYLAGLSFLVLPLAVVGAVTALEALILLPTSLWSQALSPLATWLLAQCGVSLFFFSFAAFCAMFTGHVLALPVFYGILNALVEVLYYLITILADALFYGVYYRTGDNDLVRYLTPLWALTEACDTVSNGFAITIQSPAAVAAYAAAGLMLAVLALLVYRVRHVESAGDVVSIPVVRPIFQWGVAFCSGLCFGVYTVAFLGWGEDIPSLVVSVLLWTVVGFFVAEMLLKKSFRVLKAWKRCLLALLTMALLCAAFSFDWFGVENRVPTVAEVESVTLRSNAGFPGDSGQDFSDPITDPQTIQKIIDLHKAILKDRDRPDPDPSDQWVYGDYGFGDDNLYFNVVYTLNDGSILARRYTSVPLFQEELTLENSVTWQTNQLIQDRELTEQRYKFDDYENLRLVEAVLHPVMDLATGNDEYVFLESHTQELWEAVRADFDEGTIGLRYLFDTDEYRANTYQTELMFSFEARGSSNASETDTEHSYQVYSMMIALTPHARHTLAVLEEAGVLDTYAPIPCDTLAEEGTYNTAETSSVYSEVIF